MYLRKFCFGFWASFYSDRNRAQMWECGCEKGIYVHIQISMYNYNIHFVYSRWSRFVVYHLNPKNSLKQISAYERVREKNRHAYISISIQFYSLYISHSLSMCVYSLFCAMGKILQAQTFVIDIACTDVKHRTLNSTCRLQQQQ